MTSTAPDGAPPPATVEAQAEAEAFEKQSVAGAATTIDDGNENGKKQEVPESPTGYDAMEGRDVKCSA